MRKFVLTESTFSSLLRVGREVNAFGFIFHIHYVDEESLIHAAQVVYQPNGRYEVGLHLKSRPDVETLGEQSFGDAVSFLVTYLQDRTVDSIQYMHPAFAEGVPEETKIS